MKDSIIISQQASETVQRYSFESFEQFQELIRQSFITGSGIDPELFDACIEFHCDQEFDYGGEVSTPIHDELDWQYTRFGHQVKEPMYAAFFKNEDGSTWQAVVSIWDEEKQRPYQYKVPKRKGDRVFLPPVPPEIRKRIATRYGIEVPLTGSFWEWLEDIDIPRIITEGGKKALCQLSLGYVSLALYGCTCGAETKDESGNKVDPSLKSDLERFASPESKWLFAFDRDEKQKAKLSVAAGKKRLRLALRKSGSFTADIVWETNQGKGVDDFVVNSGSGSFDAAYQKAIAALERALNKESVPEAASAQSKKKQQLNLLHCRWGEKLRFNEMTLKVELDGQPLDLDTLAVRLGDELNIDIGNDIAVQIVLYLAKKHLYNPVREYLEQVAFEYPNQDLSILDDIATRYFDSIEPLHNVFMRKHLIGQVRRVFEPGCQHDTVVVLQGAQGIQKSSFWRALAVNSDWFDDTIASSSSDKDERLKLRRFWILELAEIESVFKRKEIASLRGFLTTKCDNLRVPYGRSIESFPRTSCFVASVNPAQFLVDPEGHRRFWVIPVPTERIPVEKLVEERDRLWAAAVHAYRQGEQHWLSSREEKLNALLNKRHEIEDSWQEIIDFYLEDKAETTVSDILNNCLKIEIGRHDRAFQMRVVESLKKLGWVKGERKRVDGKKLQVWRLQPQGMSKVCPPETLDISPSSKGMSKVCPEVWAASNLDTASITEKVDIPFSENPNFIFREQPNIVSSVKEDVLQDTNHRGGISGADSSVKGNVTQDTQNRFGLDSVDSVGKKVRQVCPQGGKTAESIAPTEIQSGHTSGHTLDIPFEENEKSRVSDGRTSAEKVATSETTSPEPSPTVTPEKVVLGRQNRKKIDPKTLVGKIVAAKDLGGEEFLVIAIQENTGRLIGQACHQVSRKAILSLENIE